MYEHYRNYSNPNKNNWTYVDEDSNVVQSDWVDDEAWSLVLEEIGKGIGMTSTKPSQRSAGHEYVTDESRMADTPPSIEERARRACRCLVCQRLSSADSQVCRAPLIAAELRAYGEQRAGEERARIAAVFKEGLDKIHDDFIHWRD